MSKFQESTREHKPWTEIEKFSLVRVRREHLEELASVMRRTFDEVEEKYEELKDYRVALMEKRINQYRENGLDAKEAMARTFYEFGLDFYQIIAREMRARGADTIYVKIDRTQ